MSSVPTSSSSVAWGIALLPGIHDRQAALALVALMAVAVWVHVPNGWVHTSPGGGWEYPVFLIAASIVLWLFGDGAGAIRRSNILAPRGAAA